MSQILIICPFLDALTKRVVEHLQRSRASLRVLDAKALRAARFTLSQPVQPEIRQTIEANGWSIKLEELTGLFLPSPWFAIDSSANEKDAVFIGTEYTALIRYLAHHAPGAVINRLRPELWSHTSVEPQVVRRLVSKSFQRHIRIVPSTVLAGSMDETFIDSLSDAAVVWPFTDSGRTMKISTKNKKQLSETARLVPLRFQVQASLVRADVFVVGDTPHCSEQFRNSEHNAEMLDRSVSLCRELDLFFGHVQWLTGLDGLFLAGVGVAPIVPSGNDKLLDSIAIDITRALAP